MKQYLDLLREIKERGLYKEPARENMPGTYSLFGYQMRFNLQEGFPLLTTKKVSFKNIVVELLWFLRGDTNIKYLVDNGCNIWNEDAYNYYRKINKGKLPIELLGDTINNEGNLDLLTFQEFITIIKVRNFDNLPSYNKYTLGDCGMQYGKLWRDWQVDKEVFSHSIQDSGEEGLGSIITKDIYKKQDNIDQFKELLVGLKNNPMGRRHIITAWNPATLNDMALNACHAFVQFNCRKLSFEQRIEWAKKNINPDLFENLYITELAESESCPKYYLDCQMYQRSADSVLGVPYNIASYALLTEIISKVCNMIPGEFIHTFGDVHIYENHLGAVKEQLEREPRKLPKLNINTEFWQTESGECGIGNLSINGFLEGLKSDDFLRCLIEEDIQLSNYNPHPKLTNKTNLSTGIIK